jgi:hypothetical protein
VGRNQRVDTFTQLELGVRLLQGQLHEKNGVLHFCHTDCFLFDGGTAENYLAIVKIFLENNPDEVLTLLFTNPEGLSIPNQVHPVLVNSGITELAYVPPSLPMKQSDWPTLGDMIDSGKRVVVFVDYGAEGVSDYILPEFDMVGDLFICDLCEGCSLSVNRSGRIPILSQTLRFLVPLTAFLANWPLLITCT